MSQKLTFYYFGEDEAYFRALQGEFSRHSRLPITFKRFFEKEEKKIQSLFLKFVSDQPSCIFIDFSKFPQDYMHLARLITRTPVEHQFITVGLIDYLSPFEVLQESMITGVNLTHIKSAEIYNVVFSVTKLLAPDNIKNHPFATATLADEWKAGIPVKIGYVHNEGIHFETDWPLNKNDLISFEHFWTNKRIVPSNQLRVQEVSNKNLFYHFDYGVDANFLFVDELNLSADASETLIKEKKHERDDLIEHHKRQLRKWIENSEVDSLEKKAKILVVDRSFHFFNEQARTDRYDYTIRCIPFFNDISVELDRMGPQVIAFNMEKPEVNDAKNNPDTLVRLIRALKAKYADEEKFVIVFNCPTPSKELQGQLQYPHIMTSAEELSVDILLKIAEVYDKKLAAMPASQPVSKKNHKKVFIKKTNPASLGEINISIKVNKISETDMFLTCDVPLESGLNLHLTEPVPMYIHVIPVKGPGKIVEYHGLIHAIGEAEKMKLRQFVNSIFFRDHDARLSEETEEFKKLNEEKLKEKLERLKAEAETEEP